jgi:hypothetical protein
MDVLLLGLVIVVLFISKMVVVTALRVVAVIFSIDEEDVDIRDDII